jgi:hypothetical protein
MAVIQVPPDSTGKKVDTVTLSDAGSEVHRQKIVLAGASGTAEVAAVTSGAAGAAAMGLVVRNAGNLTIDKISATATVSGIVTISGTATVSGVVGITGTALVAVSSVYVTGAVPSASRGPRCVLVSSSANVTLVAAPGANMTIYVTEVYCTNASGANTRARIGTSASIGQVTMLMAQSGGGFCAQYIPVWKLSTNEALLGSVKPSVSEGIFNVHYFVASADAF